MNLSVSEDRLRQDPKDRSSNTGIWLELNRYAQTRDTRN